VCVTYAMIWNISKKVNGRIAVWSMLKLYLAVACDMHAIPEIDSHQ
jgi:hypothetical protein